MAKLTAYCVREKKKVEMLNPKQVTMRNGRKAFTGKDAKGHKLYRIA